MAPKLVCFVLRKELLNFSEMAPRSPANFSLIVQNCGLKQHSLIHINCCTSGSAGVWTHSTDRREKNRYTRCTRTKKSCTTCARYSRITTMMHNRYVISQERGSLSTVRGGALDCRSIGVIDPAPSWDVIHTKVHLISTGFPPA